MNERVRDAELQAPMYSEIPF